MAIGDVLKLRLESITAGGDALGRFEGKTVFTKGGAPDETVCVRITEERKTWARAEILEIIEPSAARVENLCSFYGKCGGCNLMFINYDTQLAVKTSILEDSFQRIGGFQPPVPEIFPSPPWEYRNRMQFHCLREKVKGDKIRFGLKGKGSDEIIAVTDCPIAVLGIRKILKGEKDLSLPPDKDRFTVFSKNDVFLNEGGQQKEKIKLLGKEITLDVGLFFQSNCFMLEKLIAQLQEIAQNADRSLTMADLYCGVGTFAFFLGEMFPGIILAEENKGAVSLARENLKDTKTEFFALRDSEWQRTFLGGKNKFGFAVIDPPRTGLSSSLAQALVKEKIPILSYVSCDPTSLARDSKILTDGGYKLKKLMFFDFYPQTSHIESLAVFVC